MTRRLTTLLIVVVIFLIPVSWLVWRQLSVPTALACNGTLVLQDSAENNVLKSRAAYQVTMNPDGTGYLFVNGSMTYLTQQYRLNRTVFFYYQPTLRQRGGYLLSITRVKRLSSDTTPQSVTDTVMPLLSQGAETPVWLSKLHGNEVLFSGVTGALMVCAGS